MKNRIKFQENKLENYLSWTRHYFNKYIGPIIGIALFSFLAYDNYNLMRKNYQLRQEIDSLRSEQILDFFHLTKEDLISSIEQRKIDSSNYYQQMDSLKTLEDSLYNLENQ